MTTALQLIESAMSKIGMLSAGETVSAEDAAVCLERLSAFADALENEDMFAYATLETVFTLPANTKQMTIGPGQQINMVRPLKILQQCFTRVDDIDYPLIPVSEPEYNAIALKSLTGALVPAVLNYGGQTPTATIDFYPSTGADVEIHLFTPEQSGVPADLTTDYIMPPGYRRYIEYALAIEIAPDFNTVPSPMILGAAANAKRAIRRTNSSVPQLEVDYPGDSVFTVEQIRSGDWIA